MRQMSIAMRFFRLLRIDTGAADADAEPSGQFTAHSLANCPPYVGLSYAWHEPRPMSSSPSAEDRHVKISRESTPFKPNLFYSVIWLPGLRRAPRTVFGWTHRASIKAQTQSVRHKSRLWIKSIATLLSYVCGWDLLSEGMPTGCAKSSAPLLQKSARGGD